MARTRQTDVEETSPMINKLNAFSEALSIINKDLKSETGTLIAKLSDRPMNVETISTGSVVLDTITGGGFPKGRLIEIFGAESSGKTTMALTAIANVQKDGGTAAFVDFENALDPQYAARLGVDVANLAVAQPDYAEQGLELVERLAASGVVDIIVVDSVAALVPKVELEGDLEQQTMAVVARLLSRSLKKLVSTANKTKTTVIFINQTREKVGFVMGDPTTTTGGKALKFYSSQRIKVAPRKQITENGKTVGRITALKTIKNKVAPPFMEGETVLTFNKGINRAAEMIEVGPLYPDVINKPNARTYVDTETGEIIARSKAEAVDKLEKDPKLLRRLQARLKKALQEAMLNGPSENDDADEE